MKTERMAIEPMSRSLALLGLFLIFNQGCKKKEKADDKLSKPGCRDFHKKIIKCGGEKNKQSILKNYGSLKSFLPRCEKLKKNEMVGNLIKCTVFSCNKFRKCISGNLEGAIKLSNIKARFNMDKNKKIRELSRPKCEKIWEMLNKCAQPKQKKQIKNYFGTEKRFVGRCVKYSQKKSIKNLLKCKTDNCKQFKQCFKRKSSFKAILHLSFAQDNYKKARQKRLQKEQKQKDGK